MRIRSHKTLETQTNSVMNKKKKNYLFLRPVRAHNDEKLFRILNCFYAQIFLYSSAIKSYRRSTHVVRFVLVARFWFFFPFRRLVICPSRLGHVTRLKADVLARDEHVRPVTLSDRFCRGCNASSRGVSARFTILSSGRRHSLFSLPPQLRLMVTQRDNT